MEGVEPVRSSGIPRPPPATSKLPLSRFGFIAKPLQQSAAILQSPSTRPNAPTPARAKTPSSAALPRPTSTQSATKGIPPPPKSGIARAGLSNEPRSAFRPGASGLAKSRSKSQSRQVQTSLPKPSFAHEDEENTDLLTSLDTFRSTSRQSSRLGHRSEPNDEPLNEILGNVQDEESAVNDRPSKSSRPSLSDRTIESLQNVPSTPKDRRRSSFFNPLDSPMGPPPRPGSSLSRYGGGNGGSRPGTSDGALFRPVSRSQSPIKKAPASAQPFSRTTKSIPSLGSDNRSISGGFTSRLQKTQPSSTQEIPVLTKQPTTSLRNGTSTSMRSGSRTIASSRPAKPRPALGEVFITPKKSAITPASGEAGSTMPKRVVSNSSAALRQQIAAAKAAARKGKVVKCDSPQDITMPLDTGTLEDNVYADPFNQGPTDEKHILRNRIKTARMDGKLNIAAMGLKQIPNEVRQMYSSTAMEESKVNWAEVVDLSKLLAADNDFEQLDDAVFPDLSPEDLDADDATEGNQFGGLEVLDLHGNSLSTIPIGLRRLERLTKLDLAHNKLDNTVFEIVSQIRSLKELKLAHNNLNGNVSSSLCEMSQLEVLDLQANRLLTLPEALRELVSLRVLNISGNQLTALPMDALYHLPLSELDASGNALIASLFPLGGEDGHPTLRVLNVANNSLAALTFTDQLDLPQLKTLDVTNNHMTVLPTMAAWSELVTLLVGDNKMTDFPHGFTTLHKLRTVNFSGNELRLVDPEISRMSSLETLALASNPLRERKFLTMTGADIKRDLKSRLAPEQAEESELEEPASPVTVVGDYGQPPSMWTLGAKGSLDLASTEFSDELEDTLGSFLSSHDVKQIQLQSNKITCIPLALQMGQALRIVDLSDNDFSREYLSTDLNLPSVQELTLSKCRLTTLKPLTTRLQAPNLHSLTISANRLGGPLPALRKHYPSLTALFANDNKFTSVTADALRGLNTVNLDSNNIEQLPASVGLLWHEGLRSFEVGRNAFRVPNYRVLGKGTEATMRWLRDRLPALEGKEDELD